MKLPEARSENIVVQKLEGELLIYDLAINKAFCLNETSARIYQACDGKTELDELKQKHQFTDELIFLALDDLKREKLLVEGFVSPLKGMNRREVIKKAGLASMTALPIIASLIAPTAAMAAISCGGINPKGYMICTMGVPGCEVGIAPTCSSCSATATPPPVAGCADPFPFLCTCD